VCSNALLDITDLSEADLDFGGEGWQAMSVGHLEDVEVSIT